MAVTVVDVGGGDLADLLFRFSGDDVVKAHLHERCRVDAAEARPENGLLVLEEGGAQPVTRRLRVGSDLRRDGAVNGAAARTDGPAVGKVLLLVGGDAVNGREVVRRFVVVRAEEAGRLGVVPAADGDGAVVVRQVTLDDDA